MYFFIRHLTVFTYDAPVSQSVMEVRKQPRSENGQRCISFKLLVEPKAQIFAYRDSLGNLIHHFDIPAPHGELKLTAEAYVEMKQPPDLVDALDDSTWAELDALTDGGDALADELWDWLTPSHYAHETERLRALADEIGCARRSADPLTMLRQINTALFSAFEYEPNSTKVDSPIDDALTNRKGVCQDFTHIMIALGRNLGVPCRYVSGYLARGTDDGDTRSAADASHAWVEAYLPDLGWIGFDPTNNRVAEMQHVRVAIGRDYADVPPTRGVYKGSAFHELKVAVQVRPADQLPPEEELTPITNWVIYGSEPRPQERAADRLAAAQQQQ